MTVVMLLDCMLLRSISIHCSLWVGLPGAAVSQRGSSWKVNCKASCLLFKPSGHTTMSLCCNSLHICNWWSQPWASGPCMPSIMVLTCPLHNRGTWDTAVSSHTKVYGQSMLSSASSTNFLAASCRVWKQAWWGCAHTAVRPKILLHPAVMLGATKSNTMSYWGFSTSPSCPHLTEGVQLCLCDHLHMEICHYWTKVMQPPLHSCHQFPQTGVCGKECEVIHSGLQWKKKDQLASRQ